MTLLSYGSHLFGAPSPVRFPHIRRRLDGRDELQDAVKEADEADNDTDDVAPPGVFKQEGSNEDVD